MYSAKIILDSVNSCGDRLTTFEVTYPRFVHSELMTHRLFSRNSASSRAIPNEKLRKRIEEDPVIPVFWGKNQSGMQAGEELSEVSKANTEKVWIDARNLMLRYSEELAGLGVHKQLCNRLLEPWMYITTIVTATEYENFFHLRCDPNAQPEIQKIAYMMRDLYESSKPELLLPGEWHSPYIQPEEYDEFTLSERLQISSARCARVSYLTHDGKRDPQKDIELYKRLVSSAHWSPLEHPSQSLNLSVKVGNLTGWYQFRKDFCNEHFGRALDESGREEFLELLPRRIRNRIKVLDNGCWLWLGQLRNGYGQVGYKGKQRTAHRVTRYLIRGDIPLEMTPDTILDHGLHCRTRSCVNPFDTRPGTQYDNMLTSKSLVAVPFVDSKCRNGHDISIPKNVFYNSRGGRQCNICRKEYRQNYNEANRDQILEYQREYNDLQKDFRREYDREHYQYNRDKILEHNKEYNKKYNRLLTEKSRIVRGLLEGKITREVAKAQLAKLLGVECS